MALAVVMTFGVVGPVAAQAVEQDESTLDSVQITVDWRQKDLDKIMEFLDTHPLAEIWTYNDDEPAVRQLVKKIVGDEADPRKQLELVKKWYISKENAYTTEASLEALRKEVGGYWVTSWNCTDRSELFQAMCHALGIPCVVMGGRLSDDIRKTDRVTKGGGPYQWDVVKLDGKWYLMDPTWFGSSSLAYMGDPQESIYTYVWNDVGKIKYDPNWVCSDYAVGQILDAYYKYLMPAFVWDVPDNDFSNPITREPFTVFLTSLLRETGDITYDEVLGYDDYPLPFADVDSNYSYEVSIAYDKGFINGVSADKFNPKGTVTRQEAATMLMRVSQYYGLEPEGAAVVFSDVASDSWAKPGIDYVSALGVMSGTGNGEFNPNGLYSYEQTIITMLRLFDMIQAKAG